ncbi:MULTISPECIES: hypothetical protein [unclassified Rhodococcus (in: high G+C Gram-positive bacteria)]|uniref:hypothetical protein n=1 Tax=unclassified Rhodococcus (in: high G+C Gram-positive bacteria) TaxID=192944 RepID=UPI0011EC419D|nr:MULTISPECIES: hypothetical protein [unclassified Rhodococcus (in: high G+C Gram-positive bacteria)]KAA0923271.1 hypothetical protein FQ188_19480 [Rhodococcus sp. ANT_H53B]MDI9927543.1 hypothetical protein [Rhodococcus sp. IEGM 1341]
MAVDFSWSQFLWIVFVFVGVPSTFWALVLWAVFSKRRERTGTGPLGLWATGSLAVASGFVACAGWLSWSADYRGEFRGPGLPAPTEFPSWQVAACGATVVLLCLLAAHLSRWAKTGGHVAALGTTAGFSTAFCVEASTDITGQSGVGVILCMMGFGTGLTLLMLVRNSVGGLKRPAREK